MQFFLAETTAKKKKRNKRIFNIKVLSIVNRLQNYWSTEKKKTV